MVLLLPSTTTTTALDRLALSLDPDMPLDPTRLDPMADDSLLRDAAAPLLALLARLRGSKQSEAAAEAEAAALFAAHVRRECAGSTSPCVLDVCAKDILNYQQGTFSLIEDDLARAPPGNDSAASIRVLRSACQLPQVFAHRKELHHGRSASSGSTSGASAVGRLVGVDAPRSRPAH